MSKKAILICIDGFGTDYLNESPFLKRMGHKGYLIEGKSIIPSVTNINNVSIVTGKYPDEHGVNSNYYFNRSTKKEVYMESQKFIKVKTIFEWGAKRGIKTTLLTSKEKLRSLIDNGVDISYSAEKPAMKVVKRIGKPPPIYSVNINLWLFKLVKDVLTSDNPDITYVATTDYAMHKYAPQEGESKRHIRGIDQSIQELVEAYESKGENVLICVTADHGMTQKERAVNPELILRGHGIRSKMNAIITDRYVMHHHNLGGAAYIYLDDIRELHKAIEILKETEGIEVALTRRQASKLYHLDYDCIGDILILGREKYVFGLFNHEIGDVSVRSHGSLHEMKIPIIVNLSKSEINRLPQENKDLVPLIMDWFDGG